MSTLESTSRSQRVPIFVISLTDSRQRRVTIADQLIGFGLDFEFFDAIDGRCLPAHLEVHVDREFHKARKNYGTGLLPGEIGCALSHALLYRKMVDESISAAVILEDDTLLTQEMAELLKSDLLTRTAGVDLVTFYYPSVDAWRWPRRSLGKATSLRRPMQNVACCSGYFLTRRAARKLLKAALPVSSVADWPAAIHRWPTMYCAYPRLVRPNPETAQSIIVRDAESLMNARDQFWLAESGRMIFWPPMVRAVARVASLTLLPCRLCPEIFGTPEHAVRFLKKKWHSVMFGLLGEKLE